MTRPRLDPTIRAKLNRVPKPPPFRPIPPLIEHKKYRATEAESLRRMIGYPSKSKKYDRKVHLLEAAKTCIEAIIRRKQPPTEVAIFAWCVKRDPRMSKSIRTFADSLICDSKKRIQYNEELLRDGYLDLTTQIEHMRNQYVRYLSAGVKMHPDYKDTMVREIKDHLSEYQRLYE